MHNGADREAAEPQVVETMNMMAYNIDRILNGAPSADNPRRSGFLLMVFPFDEAGRCDYVSNTTDRAALARVMQEQATFFAQDAQDGPG